MSHIANVKYRQLPMGRFRKLPIGDDDSGVLDDLTDNDLFNLNPPAPIIAPSTTLFATAPNIDPLLETGEAPISVDQATGQVSFLPASIVAAGNNPFAMTTAQAVAAGYSSSDISAAVLASGGTPAEAAAAAQQFNTQQSQTVAADVIAAGGTPAQAASAAAAATKSATQLLSSTGVARPSPVTVATGLPAGGGTMINPLTALQASTVIAGVPNYMLLFGVVGIALLAGGSKR